MLNSLLICHPTNTKKQKNIWLSTIDVYLDICIQKCISISRKITFHEKHLTAIKRLSPNRNKKCWSFHIIYLIITLLQIVPCFKQKMSHILSTISNPFPLMWHHIRRQINKRLNIGLHLWVDIHNLCIPLFPCGRN
jgi:hypothetical protein